MTFFLRLVLVMGAAVTAGCLTDSVSEQASNEKVVNVYNWSDYIAPDTISRFESEYGIKVNYDIYDSSEIVDAKLMAGSSGYDVVVHSGQFASRLSPLGVFHKLEKQRLSNLGNLDPLIIEQIKVYEGANDYSTPYMWGTTGFAYNVDMVRERIPDAPLGSGAMLFDPEIVSRLADCGVSFLDSPADVFPLALSYLGRNPNSSALPDIKAAEELMAGVRPYLRYFSSTKMISDLPNKEICVAMSWSGDYAQAAARAQDVGIEINIAYTIPQQGAGLWFDGLYIPTDSPHKDNAYLFLDFMMRPEVIAAVSNHVFYANANSASWPYVNDEVINDPGIYPDEATRQRLYPVLTFPPKQERHRTRAWARIKSGL